MLRKEIFNSIIQDKGKRVVTTVNNGVRGKRRIEKNEKFDSDSEQVLYLNRVANSITSKEDMEAYEKLATTKYMDDFKDEITIIKKVLGYKATENNSLNKDKYVLVGDIKSGKSYITATILGEILKIEKERFIDILSGIGETTVSLFRFNFKKLESENIKIDYTAITESELSEIAQEVAATTYENIKKKEEQKKEIKGCLPKNVALNTFRLKSIIKKELYSELDNILITSYMENRDISMEKFVEIQSEIIFDVLKNLREEIINKLNFYMNKEEIAIEEFIEILKYVTGKQVASFLRDIEFTIYGDIEREFQIMDSIGLNHGEGTSSDDSILRETRLLDIMDKYPDYKMIYVLNSMNTTSATLAPIEFMEKAGALNNTIIVVSQLDLYKDLEFDEFKEEKINDRIDDDLYELMDKRMIEGPLTIKKVFQTFKNIDFKENIDIQEDRELISVSSIIARLFTEKLKSYLCGIHWKRMDSILRKESNAQDEYIVGGSLEFSVSKFLVAYIIRNITNEQLLGVFDLEETISEIEFNEKKQEFVKTLLNICRVYLINNNLDEIDKIYQLRWENNLRRYKEMSMTRERVKRFEEIILEDINEDIISTFITISGK